MKKFFLTTVFFLTLSMTAFTVIAQAKTTAGNAPKWVAVNGYWVIETNINSPKLNTIYFYNDNNNLVYKEKVDGIVINLKKRRVKMDLKKVLNQSVIAFNNTKKEAENQMLVTNLMKH